MKTRMLEIATLISLVGTVSIDALARTNDGHGPGNGGTVYDCNDGEVHLVDLLEPQLRKGLRDFMKIEESSNPVEIQIKDAFARIAEVDAPTAQIAIQEWETFRRNIDWRDGQYDWKLSDDIGVVPIPEGCQLKNAIMYLSDREIEGQNALRKRMSPTHQAALEVHEVLYKMMRDAGTVKDAIPARRLTALLFSDQVGDRKLLGSILGAYLVPFSGKIRQLFVVSDEIANASETLYLMGSPEAHSKRGVLRSVSDFLFFGAPGAIPVQSVLPLSPELIGTSWDVGAFIHPLRREIRRDIQVTLIQLRNPTAEKWKNRGIHPIRIALKLILEETLIRKNYSFSGTRLVLVSPRLQPYIDGDMRP